MGTAYNPKIVTDGLVMFVDAANIKSKSYNVIPYPEDLTNGFWGKRTGCSVTPNAIAAPNGTLTADLLQGTGNGFIFYFVSFPVGAATHSFYVKANGTTTTFKFDHVGTGDYSTFNFSTLTFTTTSRYANSSYEALANGWYLIKISTSSETNNYYAELTFNSNDGGYIWGIQTIPYSFFRPYSTLNPLSWLDLSVNSRNGTLTNGPIFGSDSSGTIVMDGTNDYVSISLTGNNNLRCYNSTTMFIVNIPVVSGGQRCILSYRSGTGGQLYIGKSSSAIFSYYNGLSEPSYVNGAIPANRPFIGTVVCDATNNLIKHYVNGVFTGSVSRTGWSTIYNSVLNLGYDAGGTSEYMIGNFYNFMHYNKVLTDAEIAQNYQTLRGRYGI